MREKTTHFSLREKNHEHMTAGKICLEKKKALEKLKSEIISCEPGVHYICKKGIKSKKCPKKQNK